MRVILAGLCLPVAACAFDGLPNQPGEARSDTCAGLLAGDPTLGDDVYLLEPESAEPYQAYCDMSADGGGWTLALKIDGSVITSSSTFGYREETWTSAEAVAPDAPDLDATEAKLASFWSVPATEILLRFDWITGGRSTLIVEVVEGDAPVELASLRDLFEAGVGEGAEILPPPSAWDALNDDLALQTGCQRVEVNHEPYSWNRARLAAIADNDECGEDGGWDSPDSRIGIGLGGTMQGPAAGGKNAHNGDEQPAFVYVFVR
jgi:hypothetical protein